LKLADVSRFQGEKRRDKTYRKKERRMMQKAKNREAMRETGGTSTARAQAVRATSHHRSPSQFAKTKKKKKKKKKSHHFKCHRPQQRNNNTRTLDFDVLLKKSPSSMSKMENAEWFRGRRRVDEEDDEEVVSEKVELASGEVCGFANLGNSCFVSSSVQLLCSARDVIWSNAFLSSGSSDQFPAFLAEQKKMAPHLVNGVQQDAGEFVQSLLSDDNAVQQHFAVELSTRIACNCGALRTRTCVESVALLPLPTSWLRAVELLVHLPARTLRVAVKVPHSQFVVFSVFCWLLRARNLFSTFFVGC
jgi:hypothetical protein